jgi:uncharacterized protein YceH (UPF0502 family)
VIGPDAAELRVLGCLIEKQHTTPDAYPLSLNALRLAANQSTGRDPVVAYEEDELREAIARLVRRGWARLASGPGSRATKYRHLLDDALGLSDPQLAVLAVLMLRGAQTPGELRQRTERLHDFASVEALEGSLDALAERRLVVRFERHPGQKEARLGLGGPFASGEEVDTEPAVVAAAAYVAAPYVAAPTSDGGLASRVDALEAELGELRTVVAQLRELLD